jgi:hypothetical protein
MWVCNGKKGDCPNNLENVFPLVIGLNLKNKNAGVLGIRILCQNKARMS